MTSFFLDGHDLDSYEAYINNSASKRQNLVDIRESLDSASLEKATVNSANSDSSKNYGGEQKLLGFDIESTSQKIHEDPDMPWFQCCSCSHSASLKSNLQSTENMSSSYDGSPCFSCNHPLTSSNFHGTGRTVAASGYHRNMHENGGPMSEHNRQHWSMCCTAAGVSCGIVATVLCFLCIASGDLRGNEDGYCDRCCREGNEDARREKRERF